MRFVEHLAKKKKYGYIVEQHEKLVVITCNYKKYQFC